MMVAADGTEIDWISGYAPPPEKVQAEIERMVAGRDTFKALLAAYARNVANIATVFKLTQKYSNRVDDINNALLKYKELITLDPKGEKGTTVFLNETVSYTEYAEYKIGLAVLNEDKRDPQPLRIFVKKHPNSAIVKHAYSEMSANFYQDSGSKEEAAQFYQEYAARYTDAPDPLGDWVSRIIADKDPVDKGIELAEHALSLKKADSGWNPAIDLARLYALRQDSAKMEEVLGDKYIRDRASAFARELVGYANFWLEQKSIDRALRTADVALNNAYDNPVILGGLASIYSRAGKSDKALAVYGPELMNRLGDDYSALNAYAAFWNRQNTNLDSAIAAAIKANRTEPGIWGLGTLQSLYIKKKNYDEAIKTLEKLMELELSKAQSEVDRQRIKERYAKQREQIKKVAQDNK